MLELKICAGLKKTGEDAIASKEHDVYYFVLHTAGYLKDRELILDILDLHDDLNVCNPELQDCCCLFF